MQSGSLQATVILPTTKGSGPLLPYSVGSVLTQSVTDLELFIIGDGADDPTRQVIQELQEQDNRIRFFDHPKHISRGEPYRHQALQEAQGKIVCYLCDRDLWFSDHVAQMLKLLQHSNFAHSRNVILDNECNAIIFAADLRIKWFRYLISKGYNFIPLSFAAHTIDLYHQLPYGWRETPADDWTDRYMWQQILESSHCVPVTGEYPTGIAFHTSKYRKQWPIPRREKELSYWSDVISHADALESIRREIMDHYLFAYAEKLSAAVHKQVPTPLLMHTRPFTSYKPDDLY